MQTSVHLPMHHMYRSTMSGITVTTNETATPSAPRKRKRTNQNTYPISWSEVKEVDPHGRTREVIVIEDTPPPTPHSPTTSIRSAVYSTGSSYIPPIRTRAQAAAAAVNTGSASAAAPPTKKRKREQQDDGDIVGTYAKRSYVPNATAQMSFPSGSAATAPTDEVRVSSMEIRGGVYISIKGCKDAWFFAGLTQSPLLRRQRRALHCRHRRCDLRSMSVHIFALFA